MSRKENEVRKFNWKHELRLAPGYLILSLWILFTFVLLGWVFAASLSTTKDIFAGDALKFPTGFHFENYIKAWTSQNVSVIFGNSLFYSIIACVALIFICAPAAYVLSRFKFIANRFTLIFLYIGINVPYTTIFLLSFFSNLSSAYEQAAAIDGCTPMKTFWLIMFPMAQSGLITVTIFNFINVWNEYFMSLIFANSDRLRPVAVGLYSMINAMRYTGDWAGMFASVVIVFLPTFILYLFLSRRIIAGITGGGLKG